MPDEISNLRTPRNPMMAALMPMLTPLLQGSVGDLDRKLDRIIVLLGEMVAAEQALTRAFEEMSARFGGKCLSREPFPDCERQII